MGSSWARLRPRASGSGSAERWPEMTARSSNQFSCILGLAPIRDDRWRALASNELSTTGESAARTAEREDCVLMEDSRSALDISRACTLRASRESRQGSVWDDTVGETVRRLLGAWSRRGRGEGSGRRVSSEVELPVSASASSALSG